MKCIALFVLGIAVLGTAWCNTQPVSVSHPLKPGHAIGEGCLNQVEVSSLLRNAALAQTQEEADQTLKLLIDNSSKSDVCRTELSANIIGILRSSDFSDNPEHLAIWRQGARLLGDLKTAEGLEFLISHLELSTGTVGSRSMRQQPAIEPVIRMGLLAVPNLANALRGSSTNIKMDVVYCLTTIGLENRSSNAPLNALKQASESESDACIKHFVQVSVRVLEAKPSELDAEPNQILSEWHRAFACR